MVDLAAQDHGLTMAIVFVSDRRRTTRRVR